MCTVFVKLGVTRGPTPKLSPAYPRTNKIELPMDIGPWWVDLCFRGRSYLENKITEPMYKAIKYIWISHFFIGKKGQGPIISHIH